MQEFADDFSTIRPNRSQEIVVPGRRGTFKVEVPKPLRRRNVLVEVTAGSEARSLPIYANALAVKVIEKYGQLQVRQVDSKEPLSVAYVKVYAEHQDGTVHFYKDGYTDLLGRFDYATLSTGRTSAREEVWHLGGKRRTRGHSARSSPSER